MVKHYYIIGAGVSGLTAGLELLRKGASVTVIESTSKVGGLAASIKYDDYVIDYGPHLFHSAHPEIIEYWRELVGEKLVSKDFYSGNYKNKNIYDYPINLETAKDQYSKKEFELMTNDLKNIDSKKLSSSKNYYEYVRSLAGDFLAESFFTSYPKKLWGIDTKDLSARFAPRRIEIREKRIPFHSGPGRFAGIIEGGCGVLAEAIYKEIVKLGGKVIFESKIEKIDIDEYKNIKLLTDQNNNTYSTEDSCVISTIPIDKITKSLGGETELYFRKIILVNIVIDGDDPFPKDYDWLYFDSEDCPFHRVGVQTRFSRENIKDGLQILCCEIAIDDKDEVDVDELEKNSIESLSSMNLLKKEEIIACHSFDIGPVYPGYYVGHEHELSKSMTFLGTFPNLYYSGSLAEYAYSDQQVITAKSIDLANELITLGKHNTSDILKNQAMAIPSKEFDFGRNIISLDSSKDPFLIAEIGLCHNGSVEMCKELIMESKKSGFSSAKIQTYAVGRLSKKSRTSRYYEETLDQEESISDLLDKLIFTPDQLKEIFSYADDIDFDIFSTPFDIDSVNLLEKLNVKGYKVSSMDLINIPLIKKIANTNKPIILSTGMASIGEIEEAVNTVLKEGNEKIAVLHCVSSYPCDIEHSNLKRIKLIQNTFNVISGYSDHTIEIETPSLAITSGARVIEKHVTLNKGLDGPDHNFSLEPEEMKTMIKLCNSAHKAINGQGFLPSDAELSAKANLKRSIYAKGNLNRGDVMTLENISIKSPGDGIPAKHYNLILGKRIIQDVLDDHPLKWEHFFNE